MVVLKQRHRPVTFRVNADEYELLMEACLHAGARSVSEFARTAVLQQAQRAHNDRPGTLSGDLASLTDRLGELDIFLVETQRKIRGVLGSSGGADQP